MKKNDVTFKKVVARLIGATENETVAGIYTIASLLFMMLVASSESFALILIAVVNLYLAVRNLNKLEDQRSR